MLEFVKQVTGLKKQWLPPDPPNMFVHCRHSGQLHEGTALFDAMNALKEGKHMYGKWAMCLRTVDSTTMKEIDIIYEGKFS